MRLPESHRQALEKDGLPVPTQERVDRLGYTPTELKAIRKHVTSHDKTADSDWEVNHASNP